MGAMNRESRYFCGFAGETNNWMALIFDTCELVSTDEQSLNASNDDCIMLSMESSFSSTIDRSGNVSRSIGGMSAVGDTSLDADDSSGERAVSLRFEMIRSDVVPAVIPCSVGQEGLTCVDVDGIASGRR